MSGTTELYEAFNEILSVLRERTNWYHGPNHVDAKRAYAVFSPQLEPAVDQAWLTLLAIGEKYGFEVTVQQPGRSSVQGWPWLMVARREYGGRPLTCYVGGDPYYGTESENRALRLEEGDRVVVDGEEQEVRNVFFYDGINVVLKNGRVLLPSTRDTIERVVEDGDSVRSVDH